MNREDKFKKEVAQTFQKTLRMYAELAKKYNKISYELYRVIGKEFLIVADDMEEDLNKLLATYANAPIQDEESEPKEETPTEDKEE